VSITAWRTSRRCASMVSLHNLGTAKLTYCRFSVQGVAC
jgi:hypothetical protein